MFVHALSLLLACQTPATPSDPSWVETQHKLNLSDGEIDYKATAGYMPLKSEKGEVQAKMFFVAYTKNGEGPGHRPVTFCWNGGPGSSSIWLHMGCMSPRTVHISADGSMPKPPFTIEDNPDTWLRTTDLVFVDPVGTGFSRPEKAEGKTYWGIDGDLNSVADFIRLYLTDANRWGSPVYLAGESYGTFRAAGLADKLQNNGLALSGIVLISSAVNFNTFITSSGNDLPYMFYIPTYTAVAAYHKKLSPAMNADPEKAIEESKKFAAGEYWTALEKGDDMTEQERRSLAHKLSSFTGISPEYCMQTHLRIDPNTFQKELLKGEGYTIGRNDGRVLGTDSIGITLTPDFDASSEAMTPPFVSVFNNYVRSELGFKSDLRYIPLNYEANAQWDWGKGINGVPDESDSIHAALLKNPHLRVLDFQGIYDFATPFFGATYTLQHLGLPDRLRSHIQFRYFKGGHMMYTNHEERPKVRQYVEQMIKETSG